MIQKRLLPILFLFLILSCSQERKASQSNSASKSDFKNEWKKIEYLESKGLQGSFIQELNFILKKALGENNYPQIFKALAIRARHLDQIEEDSEEKIVESFHDAIAESDEIGKPLLQSALAELYQQYYQQNSYRIQERSNLNDSTRITITQMSGDELQAISNSLYLRSIRFGSSMNAVPLSNYIDVLSFRNENHSYLDGFSLADFLAIRALKHFEIQFNQAQLSEKVLDSKALFSAKDQFVEYGFDKQSQQADLIHWMQIITDRLSNSDQEFQRIHFDLYRLNSLRKWSTNDSTNQYYKAALVDLLKELEEASSRDHVRAELARHIHLSESDSKSAIRLCSECEDQESLGSSMCNELSFEINRKHHELNVEGVYPTNRDILFAYGYKNLKEVHFRLYPMKIVMDSPYKGDKAWLNNILKGDALISWEQELKEWDDHQAHRTEMKIEGLTNGRYVLIASDRSDFDLDSSHFTSVGFWVSDIAYLIRRDEHNGSLKLIFKDRVSGKALKGVKVELYQYEYSNRNGKDVWVLDFSAESDDEGVIHFRSDEKHLGNYRLKIEHKDQILNSFSTINLHQQRSTRHERSSLQFFTDRKIYQPGQKVRFKAILAKASEYEEEVVPNKANEVRLIDPRGEVISKLVLKTNAFGSFSGRFELPKQSLNGYYRIVSASGSYTIRVEEYRRPSFEVKFNKNDNTYRLGDSISISGKLISYTGLAMNQAKIEYRIIQENPTPRLISYHSFWPQTKRVLINSGEFKLDDNEFDIQFRSDKGRKHRQHLNYVLELNVTSPLGENVAVEKRISIYKHPYSLSASMGQSITLEELNDLKIQAVSNSGAQLQERGEVELWTLSNPKQIYIEKYWGGIDHQLMTAEEYRKSFPYYNYGDTASIGSFSTNKLLSKQAFKTNISLNAYQNLSPGAYMIKALTVSDDGDTIRFEKRFRLYDASSNKLPYAMDLWSHISDDHLTEGEEIELIIGSGFDSMDVKVELEYRGAVAESRVIQLSNEQQSIRFKTDEMEGIVVIHLTAVKEGRLLVKSHRLNIYPKQKPFEVYLKTKRDFTQPQSQEKWSLGVKNLAKGQELEILASMYDKSLDQLEDQSWNPLSTIYFRQKIHWMAGLGSHVVVGRQIYPNPLPFKSNTTPYPPELNWFGFRIGWGRGFYFNKAEALMVSDAEGMPMAATTVSRDDAANTKAKKPKQEPQIRKDFSETVFFKPHIKLSAREDAIFSFKMPDALTTYKFRAMAHDKSFNFSQTTHEVINRKELMVSSYLPAFFRKGDESLIRVKVQNASEKIQEGILSLRFFDAQTNRPIDVLEVGADYRFSLLSGEEDFVTYKFKAPNKIGLIKYQLSAKGKTHTDIEEGYIQLLPTRLLIAESFPFEVPAGESREFNYQSFLNRNATVAENKQYKVEYSSDPRWLAVYALPAVIREQEDCAEKVFSNLYARAIGSFTANKIVGLENFSKQLDEKGKIGSELELNKDLSLINYEHTPWLKAAESESLQREGLKTLFDKKKTAEIVKSDLRQLESLQLPSGAWPWFKGMLANRYLTQYILAGLEKFAQLNVVSDPNDLACLKRMKQKSRTYLDARIEEDYKRINRQAIDPEMDYLTHSISYYLYARSFDENWQVSAAASFFIEEAKAHWQAKNPMIRALIGLSLFQMNSSEPITKSIFLSMQDIAIKDSLGVHWKFNNNSPYWYNSKIESQAYLIEFFQLIRANDPMIEEMKKWLLHQKNQQHWPGSKSSIQACYALLTEEEPLIYANDESSVNVGDQTLDQNKSKMPAILSNTWYSEEVVSDLSEIKVNQSEESFGWGAAHWQYFEESDKVTSHSKNGLKITSNYYQQDAKQSKLIVIKDEDQLKVGDLIKHRLLIEVDYDLEYVYINDQPPACLQAPEMRSGMRFLDGLSFYQNMKATEKQWFIERLPRGTYVLETDYRISHSGNFTGGVSRLQCMYAPEFVAYDNAASLSVD